MARRGLQQLDWILVGTTVLITALGLLVLYSSGIKATTVQGQIDTTRQLLYGAIGLVAMFALARFDYRSLKSYAIPLYILMSASLIAVEVIGTTALGAQRWISIGFFQFQPSEFAKIALIVVLATYHARYYNQTARFKHLVILGLILVPPFVLVISQPDLGTGLVCIAIWLAMALASKVRRLYLFGGLLAVGASLPLLYRFLASYQRQRIDVLLNPQADRLGIGYNVTQSVIAVGSGGWFGRGLSAGSQSQLNFLPSQHTDFIFAVLAEKLGFVGAGLLIVLFGVLIVRIYMISTMSIDRFGSFLCIGVASMFLFHIVVNIGMNVGIMPVTGIPLPFVSAGGTSMLMSMVSIGIVLSVARHRDSKRRIKDEQV